MRRPRAWLAIVVSVNASTALACAAPAGSRSATAPPDPALVARLAAAAPEEGRFWGAVLVAQDGEVALERFYGPQDPRDPDGPGIDELSLFDLASVSKPLTATAVMLLAQQGRLSLDDAVEKFVPTHPLHPTGERVHEESGITIRHLLQHTSGRGNANIPAYNEPEMSAAFQALVGNPSDAAPGTKWAYNNTGYCVLAGVVERASGEPFDRFMRERVLKPMGMTHSGLPGQALDLDHATARGFGPGSSETALDHPWGWGARGCTGVLTCTADLLAWERALRGATLLPREVLNQMDGEPGAVPTGRGSEGGGGGARSAVSIATGEERYGLGWFVSTVEGGARRVSHTGASHGYRCDVRRYPGEGLFIAVLTTDRLDPSLVAQKLEDAAFNIGPRVFAVQLNFDGLALRSDKSARLEEPLAVQVEHEPAQLPAGADGVVLTIRRVAGDAALVKLHLSSSVCSALRTQMREALAASDPALLAAKPPRITLQKRWAPGARGQVVSSAAGEEGEPPALEIAIVAPEAPAPAPATPPGGDEPPTAPGGGGDESHGPIVPSPLPPASPRSGASASSDARPTLIIREPGTGLVPVAIVLDDRLAQSLLRALGNL